MTANIPSPTVSTNGDSSISQSNSLSATHLQKTYSGRRVVDDVSLNVDQGEVVGLLGANGAGKTTSFYMMVGLERPENGSIFLNGQDVTSLPMYLRARLGLGYLPQEPSIFRKMTAEQNILAVEEWPPLYIKMYMKIIHTKQRFINSAGWLCAVHAEAPWASANNVFEKYISSARQHSDVCPSLIVTSGGFA